MKQINPMYIALLLVVILGMVIFKLGQAKEAQNQVRTELQTTEGMAERIVALREQWDDPARRMAELDRLLRSPALREAAIVQKKGKNSIVLDAQSINRRSAEYLINKLLNDSYAIKSMTLKRLDATEASMHLEVGL